MGHVYVDAELIGRRGRRRLGETLIDTGATFTMVEGSILREVGAARLPSKVDLELGDGRRVKATAYAAFIRIGEREGPTIVLTFRRVRRVIGVETLESLGLKVDTVKGRLEETRPKGLAYFY